MELKKGKEILFNNNKFFQYIEPIGEGGTGEIHLFLDTTTEMRFAIKNILLMMKIIEKNFIKDLLMKLKFYLNYLIPIL